MQRAVLGDSLLNGLERELEIRGVSNQDGFAACGGDEGGVGARPTHLVLAQAGETAEIDDGQGGCRGLGDERQKAGQAGASAAQDHGWSAASAAIPLGHGGSSRLAGDWDKPNLLMATQSSDEAFDVGSGNHKGNPDPTTSEKGGCG
jgi:hypothetical protein